MTDFFRKNALIGSAEILGRLPLIFAAGYIARTLGPDTYGNWALVIAFQGLLVSLASLGLTGSISRLASVANPSVARGYLVRAMWMSALALVAATALTLTLQDPIAAAIGLDEGLSWLLLFGCIVAFTGVAEGLMDAYFKSREMVLRASLFVVLRSVIEVATILYVFGRRPFGYEGAELLAAYAVATLILKSLVYLPLVAIRAPRAARAPEEERRAFLRYGLPLVPAALVVFLTSQGDRFILGHLFDSDELGIYAFGAAIASYMAYLGYAINPLFLPRASVLHDQGRHGLVAQLFENSQRVYLALFTVVMVGVVLFASELVDLTAGDAFEGSEPVLILLSLAIGLEGLLGIWQWVFHLARRPVYILWFNLVYLAMNITAVIVAAKTAGPTAVAAAALVVVVVANIGRYFVARRFLAIRFSTVMLAGIAGLAALLGAATAARELDLVARIGIELAVAIGAGLALWLMFTGQRRLIPSEAT